MSIPSLATAFSRLVTGEWPGFKWYADLIDLISCTRQLVYGDLSSVCGCFLLWKISTATSSAFDFDF